jgi:hypothetical protein
MEVDDDFVQPVKEACLIGQGNQSTVGQGHQSTMGLVGQGNQLTTSLVGQGYQPDQLLFGMQVVMNGQVGYVPYIGASVAKFLKR